MSPGVVIKVNLDTEIMGEWPATFCTKKKEVKTYRGSITLDTPKFG